MSGYFWAIFFGTFALEDGALAGAIALIAQQKLTLTEGFVACFSGIVLGDIGLFMLGVGFRKVSRFQSWRFLGEAMERFKARSSSRSLAALIVISRVIPGTRLPTYVAAGVLEFPFSTFVVLTGLSVAAWVFGILLAGQALRLFFAQHWIALCLAFFLILHIGRTWLPALLDPWDRRALLHHWRRWLHFEFWPPLFFYAPMIPYYIYRSLRGGSFLLPFYANPRIYNGGLIGESKWDFLKHLSASEPSTLRSTYVPGEWSCEKASSEITREHPAFPLILKPDVGQRGYGVRILRSSHELMDYLRESRGLPLIAQQLSTLPKEAGIFYYRRPSWGEGKIFSLTDKEFPSLVGDGQSRLGDLILADPRARIIAATYFSRHREQLDTVFPLGHPFILAECGNHCQGAIFKNGVNLITPQLEAAIDRVAKTIPELYFGRFDVRYSTHEKLKQGLEFEIVEVNGAGSEATHIWDATTPLFEAYRVLFTQFTLLFSIGKEIKYHRTPRPKISAVGFVRESYKVYFRKDRWSVSS